jgi:hypothetical protein
MWCFDCWICSKGEIKNHYIVDCEHTHSFTLLVFFIETLLVARVSSYRIFIGDCFDCLGLGFLPWPIELEEAPEAGIVGGRLPTKRLTSYGVIKGYNWMRRASVLLIWFLCRWMRIQGSTSLTNLFSLFQSTDFRCITLFVQARGPFLSLYFVGLRQTYSFLFVQATVRLLHARRKTCLLLKVDIARVFDSCGVAVSLRNSGAHGFPVAWWDWTVALLSTASTSVLLNGSPGDTIFHSHDLCQGDPLSPILFLLMMEVHSTHSEGWPVLPAAWSWGSFHTPSCNLLHRRSHTLHLPRGTRTPMPVRHLWHLSRGFKPRLQRK